MKLISVLGYSYTRDLLGATFQSMQSQKMGTESIIELFSEHKGCWPSSKCKCTHLVQYNPLFNK